MTPTSAYANRKGDRLPSVTEIIGHVWNKEGLIHWAWLEGKQGRDYRKSRDGAARVGTIAHELCLYTLGGPEPEGEGFGSGKHQVAARGRAARELEFYKKALFCRGHFETWHRGKDLKSELIETPLISEKLGFGGTPDWYGEWDNVKTVIDIKTGRRAPEHKAQMGGYRELLVANGYEVDRLVLLYIPKELKGSASTIIMEGESIDVAVRSFKACMELFDCRMIIG
jgi:hypothetical protein